MPILVLQVVRGAINDKTTIDHNRNLVAELLSFVHAMCCEQDRRILHLLDHSIERASRYGIHARCWLIEEQYARAKHYGLSTAKLALVASAQVLGQGVLEGCQVQILRDQSFELIAAIATDSLQTGN